MGFLAVVQIGQRYLEGVICNLNHRLYRLLPIALLDLGHPGTIGLNQAQAAISDAIARYRKQKLQTRSNAKANAQGPFQDLDEYTSVDEIRDTYGYEIISENEMSRLVNLWELREESRHVSGPYSDRVIEMPELASHAMWNAYGETISEYNAKIAAMQKEARRIAEENFRRAANRETT